MTPVRGKVRWLHDPTADDAGDLLFLVSVALTIVQLALLAAR